MMSLLELKGLLEALDNNEGNIIKDVLPYIACKMSEYDFHDSFCFSYFLGQKTFYDILDWKWDNTDF